MTASTSALVRAAQVRGERSTPVPHRHLRLRAADGGAGAGTAGTGAGEVPSRSRAARHPTLSPIHPAGPCG